MITNRLVGPQPFPHLESTYRRLLQRSRTLRRAFPEEGAGGFRDNWSDLPITTRMDYADSKLTDVYPERELTRIPAAPRDIDHPEFPVPVLQRDSEIAAFEGRVGKVLLHAQVPKYGHVTIACHSSGRYHAADLSDAMIRHG